MLSIRDAVGGEFRIKEPELNAGIIAQAQDLTVAEVIYIWPEREIRSSRFRDYRIGRALRPLDWMQGYRASHSIVNGNLTGIPCPAVDQMRGQINGGTYECVFFE